MGNKSARSRKEQDNRIMLDTNCLRGLKWSTEITNAHSWRYLHHYFFLSHPGKMGKAFQCTRCQLILEVHFTWNAGPECPLWNVKPEPQSISIPLESASDIFTKYNCQQRIKSQIMKNALK